MSTNSDLPKASGSVLLSPGCTGPATLAQVSEQKLATFGSNLKLGDDSNEGEHLLEQSLKIKMTVQKVPESPNPLPQAPNFLGGSISLAQISPRPFPTPYSKGQQLAGIIQKETCPSSKKTCTVESPNIPTAVKSHLFAALGSAGHWASLGFFLSNQSYRIQLFTPVQAGQSSGILGENLGPIYSHLCCRMHLCWTSPVSLHPLKIPEACVLRVVDGTSATPCELPALKNI